MAVLTEQYIQTKAWDTVRGIINLDDTVIANSNGRYSAYPKIFIEEAGGLPLVVVSKPEVTSENLTIGGLKEYFVTFEIHSVVGGESKSAEKLKVLADAVRYSLLNNTATTETDKLFNPNVLGSDQDFDFRNEKKIHYDILRIQYKYTGS